MRFWTAFWTGFLAYTVARLLGAPQWVEGSSDAFDVGVTTFMAAWSLMGWLDRQRDAA